jgi:hypothetical protein
MLWRSIPPLILIAVLGACGGSDDPAGEAVERGFARQATAVCASALAEKRAQRPFPYPDFNPTRPDPAKLPDVADFLEETDTTFTSWQRRMVALGQPRHGADAWHELIAAIETHVRLNRDQITAARSGDTRRFADDYRKGVDTQAKLLDAANTAGVPRCANVDR